MLHGVPALCVPSARCRESPHANVAVEIEVLVDVTSLGGVADSGRMEQAKDASDAARTKATSDFIAAFYNRR